jgi:hypothetical protein
MSQRRDALNLIERESGLAGLILRPLSAHHFPPTIPEKEGIVDRERLLDLAGRSRKGQYRLADEYDLKEFSCPGGGCLLTDSIFAARLRDLFRYNPDCTMHDAAMLKIGRHFRVSDKTKVIVGRNEQENERLAGLSRADHLLLMPVSFVGPSGLLIGEIDETAINMSANIMAVHAKNTGFPLTVELSSGASTRRVVDHLSIDIEALRI